MLDEALADRETICERARQVHNEKSLGPQDIRHGGTENYRPLNQYWV